MCMYSVNKELQTNFRVNHGLPGYFSGIYLYMAEWIKACQAISYTFTLYFRVDQGLPGYDVLVYHLPVC